jgi:tetratricopeptide (TPR) repeat protein
MRRNLFVLAVLAALAGFVACGAYYDGNRAMGRGDYDAAIADYQRAVGEDPGSVLPRRALGRAQFAAGDLAAARETFDDLLAMAPDDWQGLFYLGLIDVAEGKREEGVSRMLTLSVPFRYYMSEELRCSVTFVAGKNLPDKETVDLLLVYLNEVERRQDYRERYDGSGNTNSLRVPLECPPMLGRVLYTN